MNFERESAITSWHHKQSSAQHVTGADTGYTVNLNGSCVATKVFKIKRELIHPSVFQHIKFFNNLQNCGLEVTE